MRRYRVRRAADVTRDVDLIEEYLVKSYQEFGEDFESAVERAAARIGDALVYMRIFVTHPHRGAEHAKIRPGIRTVTNRNFIFYFEVDDLLSEVRIVAIFFGGVEHRQQIMDRLRNRYRAGWALTHGLPPRCWEKVVDASIRWHDVGRLVGWGPRRWGG